MTWAKWIVAYVFDCVHSHTTWPQRSRTGLDYVCCLDCGREFLYSTREMRIVSDEEQLKDRGQPVCVELAKFGSAPTFLSNTPTSMKTVVQ